MLCERCEQRTVKYYYFTEEAALRGGFFSAVNSFPVRLAAIMPDWTGTPFASSLGNGTLTTDPELRERVFDHRAAVIQAENQILYLQDYARLCAAGAAP